MPYCYIPYYLLEYIHIWLYHISRFDGCTLSTCNHHENLIRKEKTLSWKSLLDIFLLLQSNQQVRASIYEDKTSCCSIDIHAVVHLCLDNSCASIQDSDLDNKPYHLFIVQKDVPLSLCWNKKCVTSNSCHLLLRLCVDVPASHQVKSLKYYNMYDGMRKREACSKPIYSYSALDAIRPVRHACSGAGCHYSHLSRCASEERRCKSIKARRAIM